VPRKSKTIDTSAHERRDRAAVAVSEFRKMLPTLNGYARAMTGNPRMRVVPAAGVPRTDGSIIYYQPPLKLGDRLIHDRYVCRQRDMSGLQRCPACRLREEVLVNIYHEIGHQVGGSFATVSEREVDRVLKESVREYGTKGAKAVEHQLRAAERHNGGKTLTVPQLMNTAGAYFSSLYNMLEDVRVDAAMFRARAGLWGMFRADITTLLFESKQRHAEETDDAERLPLNTQAMFAVYDLGVGFDNSELLDEEIQAIYGDDVLQHLMMQVGAAADNHDTLALTFPVLERLRELGFLLNEHDAEDEEEDDDNEAEPGQSDNGGSEAEDSGGEDEGDRQEGGMGDGDTGDAAQSSGSEGDDDYRNEDESGDSEDSPESGPTDDDEAQGDDDLDDAVDDSGLRFTDDDRMADDEDDTDQPDNGSESEGELDRTDSDDEGDGEVDDSEDGIGNGEDQSESDDDPSDDDESDRGESSEDNSSNDGTPQPVRYGSAEEVAQTVAEITEHGEIGAQSSHEHGAEVAVEQDEDNPTAGMTPDERQAFDDMVIALIQAAYFDTTSVEVTGIEIYTQSEIETADGWNDLYGYEVPRVELDEQALAPALMRARRVFEDNARLIREHNLKSGRIRTSVLGKRAPVNDPRLFEKTQRRNAKSYHVVIGLDISGSTRSNRMLPVIKASGLAQAELCNRLGVSFEVYAHTASYNGAGGYKMELYVVKAADQAWDDAARERLQRLTSTGGNLDGHTLEFYRKAAEASRATDKIICYYTDGEMPATNYEEELEILQREIGTCKQKGYTLIGVGAQTDSPTQHGLDTVQVDGAADIGNVIGHLEKYLR
jgi:hypothetical protein